MTKKVFVTGGSGYIGRNIVKSLVKNGFAVTALARSKKSADIVTSLGAKVAMGDMANKQALFDGMKGHDYLIHAAADTNHGISTSTQDRVNSTGTKNVYQAAKQAGISRAVHLSTEAVLLTGEPLINVDETFPIPHNHAGGYSRTKAIAEKIALASASKSFEIIIVRPRFVWGKDDTTALPQLVEAAKSGKLAWIGGGDYLTSTTHVSNLIHGLMLALEKGENKNIYFLSDGAPVEFRQFITRLLATNDVEPPTKQVPRFIVKTVVRLGDWFAQKTNNKIHGPMSWQEYSTLGVEVTLNIDKARKELGYEPIVSRQDGIKELSDIFANATI